MPVSENEALLADLEDVNGAFEVEVVVRFDNVFGTYWQRVFDLGTGGGVNNILLTQYENTNTMLFQLYQDGAVYTLWVEGVIVEGETATWTAGIDPDGLMWIEKNGVRLGQVQGVVPADVDRTDELLGMSNWPDDTPLVGAVLGFDVTNLGDADDGGRMNESQSISGVFQIDLTARFDDLTAPNAQNLFIIGEAAYNHVSLAQAVGSSDLVFTLVQNGETYSLTADTALIQGEWASWSVGADPDGTIWIDKNGVRLAQGQAELPTFIDGTQFEFGAGLDGVLLDLHVAQPDGPPAPPVPVDPVVGSGDMLIVAHQDDDLLFMNPTLKERIDGDELVTTVYLTAGDAGDGDEYWSAREAGEKAAYAYMAGVNDWVDETMTVTVAGEDFLIASSYLASAPDVRLIFLRLPDGFSTGTGTETYGMQSLEQLWEGGISSITTVDGTATYTAESLTGLLSALLEQYQPRHVHLQDHLTEYADIEHSDHRHSAIFATAAIESYDISLTVTSYIGYRSWEFEENLSPEDTALVSSTFEQYSAFDVRTQTPEGNVSEPYTDWVLREYVAQEYSQWLYQGGAADDTLRGGDGEDTLFGGSGADYLVGEAGNDSLYGDFGNDTLRGGVGNDRLSGGKSNDLIIGDGGRDRLLGNAGNDTLIGGGGRDRVFMGKGDDTWLDDDQAFGHDLVKGGRGDDVFNVGGGNDTLFGGADADHFRFADQIGQDVISDYELGLDSLQFSAALWSGPLDQAHLDALADATGPDLVLTFGNGDTLTLVGIGSTLGLLGDISLV